MMKGVIIEVKVAGYNNARGMECGDDCLRGNGVVVGKHAEGDTRFRFWRPC